jgi:hypothetical protein
MNEDDEDLKTLPSEDEEDSEYDMFPDGTKRHN